MDTPPFRLAQRHEDRPGSNERHPLLDRCCEPPSDVRSPVSRRARLTDLDKHVYCSIIGTCLTTAELRKLVPRFIDVDRERATDLQIHHAAVELATQSGEGAKALHKALDQRYALAIRQFGGARDDNALRVLWAQALKSGDVPPAYWAVMTHPASTQEIRQLAFGDVHMLSHLVGAANRADIRRLVALEEENAALKASIERQQSRLQSFAVERATTVADLNAKIDALAAELDRRPVRTDKDLSAEVARIRDTMEQRDQSIALHTSRSVAAEERLKAQENLSNALRLQLDEAHEMIDAMKSEVRAMEQAALHAAEASTGMRTTLERVRGKRIVYVGGRPGTNAALKGFVESAGGTLSVHDGGIEDRKGMLASLIPGADLVVFPVDCIDHDSMNTLKRICDRHSVAYHPLRTASVASFVAMLTIDLSGETPLCVHSGRPGLCLRHG